jgi:hypothetical protein
LAQSNDVLATGLRNPSARNLRGRSQPGKLKLRTPDGKVVGELHSSARETQNYLSRIPGPLPDRIDLHIGVAQVKFREMSGDRTGGMSPLKLEIPSGAF